jgi:AraC-like DNA-binding protein
MMTTEVDTSALAGLVRRVAPAGNVASTSISGLSALHFTEPLFCTSALCDVSICILARGHKRIFLEGRTVEYNAGNYLLSPASLPFQAAILKASPAEPFLGLVLTLDTTEVSRMLLEMDDFMSWSGEPLPALSTSPMSQRFCDVVSRLVQASLDPLERRILVPGLLREVYFEALRGPQGPALKQQMRLGQHARLIAQAVEYLRENYTEDLDVHGIARHIGMSHSALHHHFKQATAMSPMQYVKQLRLHGARARLLAGQSATQAAVSVGYASPSQFSRDFRRLFGVSPTQVRARFEGLHPRG